MRARCVGEARCQHSAAHRWLMNCSTVHQRGVPHLPPWGRHGAALDNDQCCLTWRNQGWPLKLVSARAAPCLLQHILPGEHRHEGGGGMQVQGGMPPVCRHINGLARLQRAGQRACGQP